MSSDAKFGDVWRHNKRNVDGLRKAIVCCESEYVHDRLCVEREIEKMTHFGV